MSSGTDRVSYTAWFLEVRGGRRRRRREWKIILPSFSTRKTKVLCVVTISNLLSPWARTVDIAVRGIIPFEYISCISERKKDEERWTWNSEDLKEWFGIHNCFSFMISMGNFEKINKYTDFQCCKRKLWSVLCFQEKWPFQFSSRLDLKGRAPNKNNTKRPTISTS